MLCCLLNLEVVDYILLLKLLGKNFTSKLLIFSGVLELALRLLASLRTPHLSYFTVAAQNWPWWKYLHHGNWQTLSLGFSPPTPPWTAGKPLPAHSCYFNLKNAERVVQ